MLTIAWDVDDVLNDLTRCWLELAWIPNHPDCKAQYLDLVQNPPDVPLGITRQEYLDSLDVFRLSDTARSMKPRPAALAWFARHGDRFHHLALTSRPLCAVPIASDWVFHHFGRWIRSFNFVPSRPHDEPYGYHQSKADFLRWLGKADYFIDDNPLFVADVQTLGIRTVLVPQPWNRAAGTLESALASIA